MGGYQYPKDAPTPRLRGFSVHQAESWQLTKATSKVLEADYDSCRKANLKGVRYMSINGTNSRCRSSLALSIGGPIYGAPKQNG